MAIAQSLLTENQSSTDTTSYATASISPAANSLLLVWTTSYIAAGTSPAVAVSGLSLTFNALSCSPVGTSRRLFGFIAQCGASPGSGALTFTMSDAGSGGTSLGCVWSVIQITGHDQGNPVVQCATNTTASGVSLTIALATSSNADNRPFSAWALNLAEAMTERANWAEISDRTMAVPNVAVETQWRATDFTTDDASVGWTTSTAARGIAIEIQAAQIATPAQGSGTGTAGSPTITATAVVGGTTATATATPGSPSTAATATAGPAQGSGTGAAQAPAGHSSTTVIPGQGSGTGTAGSPTIITPSVPTVVTPSTATGTGTAGAPAFKISETATPATAYGYGTAQTAYPRIRPRFRRYHCPSPMNLASATGERALANR